MTVVTKHGREREGGGGGGWGGSLPLERFPSKGWFAVLGSKLPNSLEHGLAGATTTSHSGRQHKEVGSRIRLVQMVVVGPDTAKLADALPTAASIRCYLRTARTRVTAMYIEGISFLSLSLSPPGFALLWWKSRYRAGMKQSTKSRYMLHWQL
jgi:hypothetical protein